MLLNRPTSRICRKKHKPRVKPAKITYLHNAQGQRVFKSEPQFAQAAPDETELDASFITWLKKNFGWLYATAQTNATLGQSYVYADGQLPEYALLAEYGNGAASGAGRLEYIWLPTDSGAAIPIGVYRGSRFYAIHSDHLNTPRLMTDDSNKAVWQWPYSAFGDNKPTGILKATINPNNAVTQDVTTNALLKATAPAVKYNLRFPGQYFDDESNLNQNFNRSYQFGQGRYSQSDPIGLDGGLNRYSYVEGNPISYSDPEGLQKIPARVGQHNQLNDPNAQFRREFGRDAFPDPFSPFPLGVDNSPRCRVVCPDDGDMCRPLSNQAMSLATRPGCYEVCTNGPFMDANNSNPPIIKPPQQRPAGISEWQRLLGILRGGR